MVIKLQTKHGEVILITIAKDNKDCYHLVSFNRTEVDEYGNRAYATTFAHIIYIVSQVNYENKTNDFIESFMSKNECVVDYDSVALDSRGNRKSLNIYFETKENAETALQWIESYIVMEELSQN